MPREYWLVESKRSHKAWKVDGTYKSVASAAQHRDRLARFRARWDKIEGRTQPHKFRIVHVHEIAVIL